MQLVIEMGEKKEKIELKEVSEPIVLTTYWDPMADERHDRVMQIKECIINCGKCGKDIKMQGPNKYVDILRQVEGWHGRCPHCFATNLISFRVVLERIRMPSAATLMRLRSERDGIPVKELIWGKNVPDETIEEIMHEDKRGEKPYDRND
jgi:hypothetical protein